MDIVASMEAISLAGIEATGDPRCRIRPADGLAVALLAPDAEVLLSDPFLDTHCFRLRTNVHHAPGLIGLAFEPVSWRPVPDTGGTLWLDAATAWLKRLDFTYRHLDLPETILTSGIGGTVEFEAMPNGNWIVRSWRIRMPLARMGTSRLTGKPVAVLEGIEVEGGEPVEVEVDADAETPVEVHFSAPSVAWIVDHMCRDEARPEPLVVGGVEFPMEGVGLDELDANELRTRQYPMVIPTGEHIGRLDVRLRPGD